MKSFLENALDATSVLYRLFLAAICYQVNPNLAMIMVSFYVANVALTVYYMVLKAKEDKEFIETLKGKIEELTIKSDDTDE
jgi:hypothetical protein